MWLTNLENAKEDAVKTQKPIFLQFEMDGCGGCKKLYEHTYPTAEVQQELQDWFVLLKLDLMKDRETRRQLSAYWTPSFYFLDHNGKAYYHFNGYLPPDDFRIILRLGLAETLMPRGKYDQTISILSKGMEHLSKNSLYPKLMMQKARAFYIRSKEQSAFRRTLKEIQQHYPESLEARMYYWNE